MIAATSPLDRPSATPRSPRTRWLAALCILGAPLAGAQEAPEPQLEWQAGPMTAPIGRDLAEIEIGEEYVYLDAANTQRFLEMNQNPVNGTELATVIPTADDAGWFLIFEFDESGYVPDDERDALDAEAMLETLRAGNESSNAERRKRGWSELSIVGWQEPPHYDAQTQNLSWAIIGESEGQRSINRITKLLGRRGVMTATLVAGPEGLSAAALTTDQLLTGYRYRPGSTYAEYVPGQDRLAEYGLTALVVGGAGVALAKSGLLAKLWKPIVAALVALGAGLKRLFGRRRAPEPEPGQPIG